MRTLNGDCGIDVSKREPIFLLTKTNRNFKRQSDEKIIQPDIPHVVFGWT